jgi:hypothetical protein
MKTKPNFSLEAFFGPISDRLTSLTNTMTSNDCSMELSAVIAKPFDK